jgi:hypothetical protein
MTDEELTAIRERAEKATPGPWYSYYASRPYVMAGHTPVADVETDADADFIVHARTDVPVLAAEVERLKTELFDKAGPEWAKEYTAARKAEAEMELLRAKLRDRDNELRIRDQEDAESEDMEQRAITADRRRGKAQAEVARLQGIIDQVRAGLVARRDSARAAWREDGSVNDLYRADSYAGLVSILDGEES